MRWTSAADGEFTVETVERAERGTQVILHLKEDAKEYADSWRLRSLVRRYSDHLAFPVYMPKEGAATLDFEAVNQAKALWTRPRTEITDDEYREFYRHITHDGEAPLAWSHNKVEGKREYTSLLYIPARAPFDLNQRDAARGLKLHVKRVFIMDDAEQFLPLYLRFIKGVLDSSDLPLNVSRELLQKDPEVEAMKSALTKRALDLVARLAKDEPEKYAQFWREFGAVLKEGVSEDYSSRDKLLPLLRFASTHEPGRRGQDLAGRLRGPHAARPAEDLLRGGREPRRRPQQPVHRAAARAQGRGAAAGRSRRPVDHGRSCTSSRARASRMPRAATWTWRGLPEAEKPADSTAPDEATSTALLERVGKALGDAVAGVKASQRLAESPACLTRGEDGLSESMRRVLAATGRGDLPESKPQLELNLSHPLVKRLAGLDGADFGELAQVLYDQAQLTEQGQLANPGEFARRLNSLLLKLLPQ